VKLINRGAAHHAFEGDLAAERRDQNRVPRFQTHQIGVGAVQQQIIDIDFLQQLLPPIVPNDAQRTA
jgi:hypothetical protein